MKTRKIRRFILMGFLAFSATLLTGVALYTPTTKPVHLASPAIANTSYSENGDLASDGAGSGHLRRCLPEDTANVRQTASETTTEQAGNVTHKLSYHLFKYNQRGEYQIAVILDFKGICGLAYDSGLGLAMSEMVPTPIAQSLVLQDYQSVAEEVGGIEELKRLIIESLTPSLNGTLPRFPPERIWALKQLGISLPEGKYTVEEITPYEPGRFTR